ncbi:MAG: hypothetical protein P8Z36_00215 [Gemmatimonadota bacterium]
MSQAVKKIWLGLFPAALMVLGGCGKESPTALGGSLVKGNVRTYQVTLNAADFLVTDTTFDNFEPPGGVPFVLVANQFEGTFTAHTLLKYRLPTQFTYTDTTDNSFTDTLPQFTGGTVVLYVDTTANRPPAGTGLSLYRLTEPFDTGSVSWTTRIDTGSVNEPWTQPGGTTGALIDTTSLAADIDSITFHVDSATAVMMADTATPFPGMLVETAQGARVRFLSGKFMVDARPTAKPDTIIALGTSQEAKFIYNIMPPAPGDSLLRVGGIPGWRTIFRFRPLEDAQLNLGADCGLASCVRPMKDLLINYAALELTPHYAGGFRPEAPFLVDVLAVLESPGVPLVRSPLSQSPGGVTGGTGVTLATDPFTAAPQDTGAVEVPITLYLRTLASSSTAAADRHTALAVAPINPSSAFGYGEFMSVNTADAPKLRLIVSVINPGSFQ